MQVKCVSENIYKKKLCKSSLGETSGGKLAHDASVRCGWNIRLIFRETEHLRIIGLSYVSVRLPKVKLSHTQLPLKLLLREPRWAALKPHLPTRHLLCKHAQTQTMPFLLRLCANNNSMRSMGFEHERKPRHVEYASSWLARSWLYRRLTPLFLRRHSRKLSKTR